MKASILVVTATCASLIGGVAGYGLATRADPARLRETYLVHDGLDRQAHAYLQFLRTLDAESTEALAKLRRDGLAILKVYVEEVADLRTRHGYTWTPIDRQFYADASDYLAKHQSPKN